MELGITFIHDVADCFILGEMTLMHDLPSIIAQCISDPASILKLYNASISSTRTSVNGFKI